jgi:hypothetical protein
VLGLRNTGASKRACTYASEHVITPALFQFFLGEMGCPALGIWVGFLKQRASCLVKHPKKKFFKKNSKK